MGVDHPLFLLAVITLIIVLAFAGWNLASVRRRQKYGSAAKGIGSDNDPMA